MFKTLTAGLMAVSLTFSHAAPAQANGLSEDDIGKLLFGLVASAAIASAIKNNRDNDRDRATVQQKPRVNQQRQTPPLLIDRDSGWRDHPRGRDHPRARDRLRSVPAPLPAVCMRLLDTRQGIQRVFGARCLDRNYAQARHLPAACEIRFRLPRGVRNGYDARCLRQNGYSLQR